MESDRVLSITPEFTLLDLYRTPLDGFFCPLLKYGWTFGADFFSRKFWASGYSDIWADGIGFDRVRGRLSDSVKKIKSAQSKKVHAEPYQSWKRLQCGLSPWNLADSFSTLARTLSDLYGTCIGSNWTFKSKAESVRVRIGPVWVRFESSSGGPIWGPFRSGLDPLGPKRVQSGPTSSHWIAH